MLRGIMVAGLLLSLAQIGPALAQPPLKTALDQPAAPKPADAPPAVIAIPKEPRIPTPAGFRKLIAAPSDRLRGGIDPGTPLKDALDTIGRLAGAPTLMVDIRINYALFKACNGMEPDLVDQKKVGLGALPKGSIVVLDKLLSDVLAQAEATYLIQNNIIVVVPDKLDFADARWASLLSVNAQLDKQPLSEALEQLSDQTGITIALDGTIGEKANTPVSATFKQVPITAAVRILANMADLKPVVIDNVLYITTKEKANELIEDNAATAVPMVGRGAAGV